MAAITKSPSSTAPGEALRAVTPHASNPLSPGPCRALWVGTGGDLVVIATKDSAPVTLVNVPDGTLIAISCIAVRISTASDIVAIY